MIDIEQILITCKTIAVVGVSDNIRRPAYDVSRYMMEAGYDIIPVNPGYETVLGRDCYPDLLSIPKSIDIVNVFRRSDALPDIVEQTIAIQAPVLWLQLGVHHPQAEQKAQEAGIRVISGLCLKVAHNRLF